MNITVNGLKINYEIDGQGDDTVVVLQGWGTGLEVYASVAACIQEKYRVIRLDLPGFGASEEPKDSFDVAGYADFFIDFLACLNISRVTLIGHSYGGRVIINLASRDNLPFEIEKIVLIDSAGVLPQRTPGQQRKIARYKMLKKMVDNPVVNGLFPDLVNDWKSRQGSEDYRNASPVMRKTLVMAVNEDMSHLFPKIKQEVLLIWGDLDTATPISDAKKMEELMPNAGLAVIPNTGHYSFLENPQLFRKIMSSYFKMEANS